MCAAMLRGQQAPASGLEFPGGQVQGQLLAMDPAGRGCGGQGVRVWAHAGWRGVTGQVRPCQACAAAGGLWAAWLGPC